MVPRTRQDSLDLRHKIMSTEMRDMGVGIADTADGKGFVCVTSDGCLSLRLN